MCKLAAKTRELLRACDLPITDICKAADLSYPWVIRFKADEQQMPAVDKIERLYEFLSGKELQV